ncbi:hypothetical protein CELL_02592 [Cellulomonas sp. T2.31MG-18]|uniref:hypothetical protein n=1 Tax=Cellulomonas sp. T2.31MG-18 TaxID=3157619 RepID=UPI0035F0EEA0
MTRSPAVVASSGTTLVRRPGRAETRLRRELEDLGQRSASQLRVLLAVWRHPAVVLLPLGAIVGVVGGLLRQDGDQVRFRAAGFAMVGPGFFHVFADSWIQLGPLYLLALGLVARLAATAHLSLQTVGIAAAALHGLAVVWLSLTASRHAALASGTWVRRAQWMVTGTVLAGGILSDALVADHPEELLLGFVLVLAAVRQDSGRNVRAAGLLVVAMGIKEWAITCAGLLLNRGSIRRRACAVALLVVGTVALIAPFKIWGEVSTFSQTWLIPKGTWFDAVPFLAGRSGWTFRVVQGGAAGLAGVLIGLRARTSALVVVMVSICVRLLLDPLRLTYYWGALVAVVAVWVWTTESEPVRRVRGWLTAAMPMLTFCTLVPSGPWWHAETVVAVALPVFAVLADRVASRPQQALVTDTEPGTSLPDDKAPGPTDRSVTRPLASSSAVQE